MVKLTRRNRFAAFCGLLSLLGGCCSNNPSNNTTTCSITFADTGPSGCTTKGSISGFVVIGPGTSIQQGANIVVQWSTDSFASTTYIGAGVVNSQGMVAVPYGFNVSICGPMTIQARAFQDPNFSGTWVAGEAAGRYDGTQTGNAAFTAITLDTNTTTASGITIVLDGTAAQ